jgi:hypothetical protein
MTVRSIISSLALPAFLVVLALPANAGAQHGRGGPPPVTTPPSEATQFDFLVGQWEVIARPGPPTLASAIHGAPRLPGTWKAWRGLDGFGIEDEMRLTDEAGNALSLAHGVRAYDPAVRHWNSVLVDVYRSVITTSTAEWKDGQMVVSARGTDADGKPYLARTRFYDIKPASFRYQSDRSYDDGKTWTEGILKIDAKRTAATAPR